MLVTTEPARDFGPATLQLAAKFQCGWYQYVHRWEFDSTGNIHAALGMGGALNPYAKDAAHVHHMYFRVDLDIDGFGTDVFEVFDHSSFTHPGGDAWKTQSAQGKFLANPASAPQVPRPRPHQRERHGREAQLRGRAPPDRRHRHPLHRRPVGDDLPGDIVQQGADVGFDCTDKTLGAVYAQGPLNTASGSDIVLWIAIRHHHEPRWRSEEAQYLPYHYEEFHITPRGF